MTKAHDMPLSAAEIAPRQSRSNRVEAAYSRLKHAILSNDLLPGFQASEPEIAALLGMSRTPVREAMIRLQAEGLIELVPRRGVRILPILASDMKEIYEILTALEPSAAEELARRRPSARDLEPLERATREMEVCLKANDLEGWADADDRFHRTLLRLHGNHRLMGIVQTLFNQAHRARMVTLRLRAKPVASTREHRQILTLMAKGEAEAVGDLFRVHRKRAASELLAILENYKLPLL